MADYIVHKAVEHSALSAKAKAALEQTYRWVLSPKYDGCHVVFLFEDGEHVGTLSRTGEPVLSMNRVAGDLKLVYPHLLEGKTAICGEAWVPGLPFNEISGKFRRHGDQPDLHFVPFDAVLWRGAAIAPELYSPAKYSARANALLIQEGGGYHRVILPRLLALSGTFSEVMPQALAYAQEHKARTDSFFDGAVLAKADGLYEVGAGKGGEFIKIKPLLSVSVVCTGYFTDTGEKTGKATGGLLFDLDGKEQRVATGLTQTQVEDLAQFVGQTVEVEAMGYTANGYLREPRFKGVRCDA